VYIIYDAPFEYRDAEIRNFGLSTLINANLVWSVS
jgi:hypothetical protein